ncbi:hypothetical protein ElyMa_005032400 [Elysia marginata]|uniref:Uncharacterized protein n=1 Tax=Elysia marginata TaxID=1093978 RepID=A0AAV4JBZ6_9GAST|nr:hypothetical protein ElyMa_005032400 [Elysia marginata]
MISHTIIITPITYTIVILLKNYCDPSPPLPLPSHNYVPTIVIAIHHYFLFHHHHHILETPAIPIIVIVISSAILLNTNINLFTTMTNRHHPQ